MHAIDVYKLFSKWNWKNILWSKVRTILPGYRIWIIFVMQTTSFCLAKFNYALRWKTFFAYLTNISINIVFFELSKVCYMYGFYLYFLHNFQRIHTCFKYIWWNFFSHHLPRLLYHILSSSNFPNKVICWIDFLRYKETSSNCDWFKLHLMRWSFQYKYLVKFHHMKMVFFFAKLP